MTKPKSRAEYREKVARAFVNALTEKGLAWSMGWCARNNAPQNAVSKYKYSGINHFYLSLLSIARGYSDPRWATMTQIMDRNGKYHPREKWHLQKGSKAEYVEFWYQYDTLEKKMVPWAEYQKLSEEERKDPRYMLRVRYTAVFHASMIDGISPMPEPEIGPPRELSDMVEQLAQNMGVELLYDGGDDAFYRITEDKIHLPVSGAFFSDYELNATALHELTHATGHESRLNRDMSGSFGSAEYAYEELVAEIGSTFMGLELDMSQMPQHLEKHKAYVQFWIQAIQDKPETLAKAIADAQKAADYMDAALQEEPALALLPDRSIQVEKEKTEMAEKTEAVERYIVYRYSGKYLPEAYKSLYMEDMLEDLQGSGEVVGYFESEEEAKNYLEAFKTEVEKDSFGRLNVKMYAVEEHQYSSDGELLTCDVIAFTEKAPFEEPAKENFISFTEPISSSDREITDRAKKDRCQDYEI